MASRKNYFSSQISFSSSLDSRYEFHETDIWSYGDDNLRSHLAPSSPEPNQSNPTIPASRLRNRSSGRRSAIFNGSPAISTSSSLPVNIPDWSKIEVQDAEVDVSDGDDDVEDRVPPHEYVARQLARRSGMVVAFSVQEGVGRTLKGRDLRQVRNAIWKQTGFED